MFSIMLMSLVIVGAIGVWWFLMGGKDFIWDVIKLIFGGDLIKSVLPEKEQEENETLGQETQNNSNEILRRSEPIVRKPLLQLETEERVPMNAFLGKRI